jgi:hypothetical protein
MGSLISFVKQLENCGFHDCRFGSNTKNKIFCIQQRQYAPVQPARLYSGNTRASNGFWSHFFVPPFDLFGCCIFLCSPVSGSGVAFCMCNVVGFRPLLRRAQANLLKREKNE